MMTRHVLFAGLLALTIGIGAIDARPAAAGSVTFRIQPRGEAADAISNGFRIYSLVQQFRNSARIRQTGNNNAAAIAQNGSGNLARVVQRGSGHTSSVTQNGNNNMLGVFQFGRNTSSNVTQTGNGRLGLVFQAGW